MCVYDPWLWLTPGAIAIVFPDELVRASDFLVVLLFKDIEECDVRRSYYLIENRIQRKFN